MRSPRYRIRWRVARRGKLVARWSGVETGPQLPERILAAAKGAVGGEFMVSIRHEDGTTQSVMTSRRELGRWNPEEGDLPAAADGAWARELATGDRRSSLARAVGAIMRDAVTDDLLSLEQGAAIAHSVSLAIDGLGPFSASSGRRR